MGRQEVAAGFLPAIQLPGLLRLGSQLGLESLVFQLALEVVQFFGLLGVLNGGDFALVKLLGELDLCQLGGCDLVVYIGWNVWSLKYRAGLALLRLRLCCIGICCCIGWRLLCGGGRFGIVCLLGFLL